ncbi:RING finger and WD repeat domain-containing protein 3 [Mortierella antarctica]|nr:RING finger and WD repeat domain-containing protein 3 [Mortierella antarctica]
MDDFADVQDSALASDIENGSGDDSNYTGDDEVHVLQQPPPQEAPSALEHFTPSQDQDFQSQVQVVVRPIAGAGQSLVPEPRPKNIETEDVRRIWSKSVVVLDTVEKEEAYSRVKKELELRMRCEKDLAHSKMAYEMLKSEMTKLQKKFDRQRALKRRYRLEVQQLKSTNPEAAIAKKFSYMPLRTIPVSAAGIGMANYLSYRQDEEMLVCSRQINNVYGLAKVSMRDYSNNLNAFIPIHSQAIRDVQCYPNSFANKSLVLTASMDKTLKISSTASQQVVLTTNPFTIYCSVKGRQTGILTLDLRNTKAPVAAFSQPSLIGHSPIHSMCHIDPSQSQTREAILCGNLEGAFIYNFENDLPFGSLSQEPITSSSQGSVSDQHLNGPAETRRVPLRLQGGSCSSVSFDSVSRHWMASFKFLGSPLTQHIRGTLELDTFGGDLELKSKYRVTGGQPVSSMSRTSIFSRLNGAVHMAAGTVGKSGNGTAASQAALAHGDASLERVILETSGSKDSQSRLAIKDIKSVVVGHDEFVVALSDKELELYRWTDDSPQGDNVESDELDGGGSGSESEREGDEELGNRGKRRRVDDHGDEDESRVANAIDVADLTIDDSFMD